MESIACRYCGKTFIPRQSKNRFCSVDCGNANRRATDKQSLERKLFKNRRIVAETGCWEWTGALGRRDYGLTTVNYKSRGVHRVSAHIYFDFDMDSELVICHKCDNPKCFNPDHLFAGTPKDNTQDMLKKKRNVPPKGERNGQAKLTEEDVRSIRNMAKSGVSQAKITALFGLSHGSVSAIVSRKRWKHVD